MVAGGLVGIRDSSHGQVTFSPYITSSVEVLDVTNSFMQYYMQHQPQSASVVNANASSRDDLQIRYDANLDVSIEFSTDQSELTTLEITDVCGVSISRYESYLTPGHYSVPTNGLSLRNGMYFVHISSERVKGVEKFAIEK
jgi:hypothetical protein